MGKAPDMKTPILDSTYECLSCFEEVVDQHGNSILEFSFTYDDFTASGSRIHTLRDFLFLRDSFVAWIEHTGALSTLGSSLNAKLQDLAELSAVIIELLAMILSNLQKGWFIFTIIIIIITIIIVVVIIIIVITIIINPI